MTPPKRQGPAMSWMARPLPGLALLAVLTVLAILVSWSLRESAAWAYWLSAQLIPVLYGVLAWGLGRGTDTSGPGQASSQTPQSDAVPPAADSDRARQGRP